MHGYRQTSERSGEWLVGGGGMCAVIRAFDWSGTPLGPIVSWPQSLRTAVSICLGSRFPMLLWWGPELVSIYNDAFISVLGGWHPRGAGHVRARRLDGHLASHRPGDGQGDGGLVEAERAGPPRVHAVRVPGGDVVHVVVRPDPRRDRPGAGLARPPEGQPTSVRSLASSNLLAGRPPRATLRRRHIGFR